MNDSLFLPVRQGAAGVRALAGWECCWMPLGEGEAEGLPAGRGESWEHVEVPAQLAAVEGRSAVWYRARFPRPDHSGRVLLRFGGAFLAANVWLNGRLLGSHYGYFAPFGFDATPHLKPDNLLVVCCESPVEPELTAKRHIMGWLNDGDSRPYPESAWRSLPDPYRFEVPIGLWRPVELEYVDNVVADGLRLSPRLEADVGRLDLEVRLRNLDGREMRGEVAVEVATGGTPLRVRREFRVGGGLEHPVAMSLSIPSARRWLPWRLGPADLYGVRAEVTVDGRPSARLEDRFGFADLQVRPAAEGWEVKAGGRPFFLRGADYLPGYRLDQLSPERFAADLTLAREANLDAVRVHALVLPEEFYAAADEAGMVVLADLPLTRAYAYHAPGEEARFFERAVRAQVPEMVELLRNRPSVAMWSGHDDAAWLPSSADLADVHTVRQNYTVDQEARAIALELDPSRPALAASGEMDEHLWAGWREAGWAALADADPRFVTEYGAQALPSLDSPVWDELGRRWPVADDEPAWLYAGFQAARWAEHGVGLPSEQESLEHYVDDSQEYQAFLISYATDQFRRRKFQRCFGAFAYHLVDPVPGVGFGLLDSARRPRLAYAELARAMAPVRLIAEPTGFVPLVPLGFGWRPGTPVTVRLVVVNDEPGPAGSGRVRWSVTRERGPQSTGMGRLKDAVRRKSFSGEAACRLPAAAEPALQVTTLSLPLEAEGDYRLTAELLVEGRLVAEAALEFTVSDELPDTRERPLLPGFLAARLVETGSLRISGSSVRFALRNRTRPAVLAGVGGFRLDGVLLPGARVLVETASGRVPVPRRLELPLDLVLPFAVELDRPAPEGARELELDLAVPGVASGRVRIGDSP